MIICILGENPAPELGTEIVYHCPAGHFFEHDLYAPTRVTVRCQESGAFTQPTWHNCVVREFVAFSRGVNTI